MRLTRSENRRLSILFAVVTLIGWILLLVYLNGVVSPEGMVHAHQHHESFDMSGDGGSGSWVGWMLMLLPMMAPTVYSPIRHVLEQSFSRLRILNASLFVGAYFAVWVTIGAGFSRILDLVSPVSVASYIGPVLILVSAVLWHCSPLRQKFINRLNNHPSLCAFGMPAIRDSLRFGITHGIWCLGSCGLIMLLPFAFAEQHLSAMVLGSVVILNDRLESPKRPEWRLNLPSKIIRLLLAQLMIHAHRANSSQTRDT